MKKNKSQFTHVTKALVDGGYTGELFATGVSELIGAKVEVVK